MLTTTSPFSFILFGASGHLATLKIYPALYTLSFKKRLPDDFAIVGFSRSEMDDGAFRSLVAESIRKDMQGEVNEQKLADFLKHVHYFTGQYDSLDDYRALATKLDELEKSWAAPVRLAYLSIPPAIIPSILEGISGSSVHHGQHAFRLIVEKPVGMNLRSFEAIRKDLTTALQDEEIYLLDHYLGKEAVRNIYYLRLANPMLERLFKNTLIHHVEITASESAGIEGRAGYFEHTGTFRDMFQSHLLMMASLLTMHLKDNDELIPESRFNALKQFYLPPAGELAEIVMQAQYSDGTDGKNAIAGYQHEEGVAAASRTNTFAAMKLLSRESRWQGVPFYLRSGKRMKRKETRISLQFQEPRIVGEKTSPNRLDIILQGEAGMRMHLQTKLGGIEPIYRPLILEDPLVCMGDCLPEHGLLLLEAIHGKKDWFLTFDEVGTAWRLVDPLQSYLERTDTPLSTYAAGSTGPSDANEWIERDGIQWF